jgi:hypothetical protein
MMRLGDPTGSLTISDLRCQISDFRARLLPTPSAPILGRRFGSRAPQASLPRRVRGPSRHTAPGLTAVVAKNFAQDDRLGNLLPGTGELRGLVCVLRG